MFPHRDRRCSGGSRQAGLLGDQSEDLFERRVGGRRPGASGDSYGQGIEGLTVARFGRSSRKQVAIPSSVFGSIGPHGGSLSHTRCAGTGAAPQPSRRPSLELAWRKNTTARAAVRLLAEFRPETPMLSTRNGARPSPKGHSLAEYSGVRGSLRACASASRGRQHCSPTPQSLPRAAPGRMAVESGIFYRWGGRSEPRATGSAEPKNPTVETRPAGCLERGSRVLMASLRARMTSDPNAGPASSSRADQWHAVTASFLGWTLDAFDFFVLVFLLDPLAAQFQVSKSAIVATMTAPLALRPVGAVLFGLLADRYGRRRPFMANVVFFSVIELLCGFAPNYAVFLILRALYGIGMGGEWGVGASLAMESAPAKRR